MFHRLLLFTFTLLFTCHNSRTTSHIFTPRLIGGTVVLSTDTNRYTFQVLINVKDTAGLVFKYCSGALVSTSYVITSTSCVIDGSTLEVVLGRVIPTDTTTGTTVTGTLIYQKSFFRNPLIYDIGLIKLATPVTLGADISLVSLPATTTLTLLKTNDLEGQTVRVVGFDKVSAGQTWTTAAPAAGGGAVTTPSRKYTDFTVMDLSSCFAAMTQLRFKPSSLLSCLKSSSDTVGACYGDLGAPVVTTDSFTLVGILTYYQKCGETILFSRLSLQLSWIRSQIGI